MSAKVPLSSWWCLIRNELVISFPDSQSASEYQRANPEGRILSQANREVYLPRPQGLIAIRCSSQSNYALVLEFASEEETMAWHTKVLISSVFSAFIKTRAYIPREVKIDKFLPGGLRLGSSRNPNEQSWNSRQDISLPHQEPSKGAMKGHYED